MIDKLMIKEIYEEAKVNRGMFYLHYAMPDDPLREIEEQFIAENMSSFFPIWNSATRSAIWRTSSTAF